MTNYILSWRRAITLVDSGYTAPVLRYSSMQCCPFLGCDPQQHACIYAGIAFPWPLPKWGICNDFVAHTQMRRCLQDNAHTHTHTHTLVHSAVLKVLMTAHNLHLLLLTLISCVSPAACSKCLKCKLLPLYDSAWWQWQSVGGREDRAWCMPTIAL